MISWKILVDKYLFEFSELDTPKFCPKQIFSFKQNKNPLIACAIYYLKDAFLKYYRNRDFFVVFANSLLSYDNKLAVCFNNQKILSISYLNCVKIPVFYLLALRKSNIYLIEATKHPSLNR